MQKRNEQGQTLEQFLADYNENKYRHPSVTVDMAVFTTQKNCSQPISVLMIERRNHPNIGMWALPGGFVEMDESLEDAAKRELKEETGVDNAALYQCGAYGAPDRDPRTRVITVAYFALAPEDSLHIVAGDDAKKARLYGVDCRLETFSARGAVFGLTLCCEQEKLHAKIGVQRGLIDTPYLIDGGGIASDHALIIFCALRALRRIGLDEAADMLGCGSTKKWVCVREQIAPVFR